MEYKNNFNASISCIVWLAYPLKKNTTIVGSGKRSFPIVICKTIYDKQPGMKRADRHNPNELFCMCQQTQWYTNGMSTDTMVFWFHVISCYCCFLLFVYLATKWNKKVLCRKSQKERGVATVSRCVQQIVGSFL